MNEIVVSKHLIIMDRKKFLTISLLSFPALIGSSSWRMSGMSGKAFVLKSGLSRFGVPTPFMGVFRKDLIFFSVQMRNFHFKKEI
jgi:hypothetical protein